MLHQEKVLLLTSGDLHKVQICDGFHPKGAAVQAWWPPVAAGTQFTSRRGARRVFRNQF